MSKKQFNDTLILNRAWIPVQISTWKKAIATIYKDHAKALDRDFVGYEFDDWLTFGRQAEINGYNMVHSAKMTMAIPEIIVLTKYDKLPPRDIKYSRENIFNRDDFKCQFCGQRFKLSELTVDHVVPKSKGGKSTWDNIVSACKKCNNKKADRTPDQANMKLIHKPVKPKWIDPITNKRGRAHICESWKKYMPRMDDHIEEDTPSTGNARRTKHGREVKR